MAVKDKARLRARLVGLYPTTQGFLQERLDALAAKLKATDDSTDEEIETELSAINDSGFQTFEEIKKADDKHRNEINKLKKPVEPPKEEDPKEDPVSTDPAVAAMQKKMQELMDKLEEKEKNESLASLSEKFKNDERLKGVPASWVRNNMPKSSEDFETAVEKLVEEYGEFATEHKLSAFGKDAPPAGTPPKTGEKEQVSMEDAKNIVGGLLGNYR